jgi:hypothetical protein
VRLLVDKKISKISLQFPAEYNSGEIYIDFTEDSKADLRSVIMADTLSLGFGEKNDVINYQFSDKIDAFTSDPEFIRMFASDMGRATHFSKREAIDACAHYESSN